MKLNLKEVDLLHPKTWVKWKPDDWKIVVIWVLLFFLANTIAMSVGKEKKNIEKLEEVNAAHIKDLGKAYAVNEEWKATLITELKEKEQTHYHKWGSKRIRYH